ncbi:hypothetical protein H5410_045692 [Solanum commersonii]|uniref:Uncharacterized protein n=1 Tax=Solanum commersonii TaxID=4109 RepID=A0A9J5XBX8_SOLCO|nr:hypothetical protein H5410_045692 [Solanum commersonii]
MKYSMEVDGVSTHMTRVLTHGRIRGPQLRMDLRVTRGSGFFKGTPQTSVFCGAMGTFHRGNESCVGSGHLAKLVGIANAVSDPPFCLVHRPYALVFSILAFWNIGQYNSASLIYSTTRLNLLMNRSIVYSKIQVMPHQYQRVSCSQHLPEMQVQVQPKCSNALTKRMIPYSHIMI